MIDIKDKSIKEQFIIALIYSKFGQLDFPNELWNELNNSIKIPNKLVELFKQLKEECRDLSPAFLPIYSNLEKLLNSKQFFIQLLTSIAVSNNGLMEEIEKEEFQLFLPSNLQINQTVGGFLKKSKKAQKKFISNLMKLFKERKSKTQRNRKKSKHDSVAEKDFHNVDLSSLDSSILLVGEVAPPPVKKDDVLNQFLEASKNKSVEKEVEVKSLLKDLKECLPQYLFKSLEYHLTHESKCKDEKVGKQFQEGPELHIYNQDIIQSSLNVVNRIKHTLYRLVLLAYGEDEIPEEVLKGTCNCEWDGSFQQFRFV